MREATQLSDRAQRAAELAARYPEAPARLATRDELADEVAAALDSWRRRPAPVSLTGPSASELEEQLAAIPVVPQGDRRPDRSVTDAARVLDLADEGLRQHLDRSPSTEEPEIAEIPSSSIRRAAASSGRPASQSPAWHSLAVGQAPAGIVLLAASDRDRGVGAPRPDRTWFAVGRARCRPAPRPSDARVGGRGDAPARSRRGGE